MDDVVSTSNFPQWLKFQFSIRRDLHNETIDGRDGVGDPVELLDGADFCLQNNFCKKEEKNFRQFRSELSSIFFPPFGSARTFLAFHLPKSRLLSMRAFVQIKAANHACTTPHKTVQFVR